MLHEPSERLVGRLFGDVVAASDRPAGDLGAIVAPNLEHVVIDLAGVAPGTPYDEQWALHLIAGAEIGVVHVEIAGRAGAVVLARAADGLPVKAAHVCGKR